MKLFKEKGGRMTKLCKDCAHYRGDDKDRYGFKTCLNEKVNAYHSYFLVDANPKYATECTDARGGGFFARFYKACGPSGKLFKEKEA